MTNTENNILATLDLTQSQLLIWMGQRLNPKSPMYNMAIAFELQGQIEAVAFKSAFQSLVNQCDAMRTVFTEVEGTPKQVIKEEVAYDMEVLDFSEMENKELHLESWKKRKSQYVFDIQECLFESVLIKLTEEKYLWFFNQHHLITDAWATTLQYKAMATLYGKVLNNEADLNLSIPLFQNYIQHLNFQCSEKSYQKAEHHWKEKAKELPERPLFYDSDNSELKSHSIRRSIKLGKERSEKLRALTKEPDLRAWTEHLSLFNLFSTILFSYLYRITGQQRLTIGTPAHNRSTLSLKETPGLFIELFPLTTTIADATETFNSLLQKVKIEANDYLRYAQPNTSTPDLNRSFNVVLNYINASFSDFGDIPMQSEWVHSDYADAGHHLRMQVHDFDGSGEIELCFDMNTTVFNQAQREATPQYFMSLLDAFIEERYQPVGKPALTTVVKTKAVSKNLDFKFNDQTLALREFEKQTSNQTKETVAIRYDNSLLTYAELEAHANKLAHYLIENGVGKNDRVAILLSRSPEFVIALLAILKTGAAFVPIPTNYPNGRVLGILEDAKPKLVLSNSVLSSKLRVNVNNLIQLDKEAAFIASQQDTVPSVLVLPEDTAYLMYTSGSTGLPKGVMISHQSLTHYIQWAKQMYCKDFVPVVPLFTSVGFDLTITSLFLPLISGGTIICYPEAEDGPDLALLKVMEDNLVNLIKLTPSHLTMLRGGTFVDSKLKSMIVGGENFKTELAVFAQKNIGQELRIFNEYGPTEATVGCVVHEFDSAEDAQEISVPIGKAIANTDLFI
ncbi:MAG: AMP-binding protein, partial [Saprospiraceae bacterium]